MITGLGLYKKYRTFVAFTNLIRFTIRQVFVGFETANLFLKSVDKYSVQLILRKNGATIGKNCDIESGLTFHNVQNYSNLIIGNNTHIGKNVFFDLKDKVIIGDNVVVSMNTTFITHIDLGKSELTSLYPLKKSSIKIEKNCYIGANVTILMGITVMESSIVAANSLVNRNVMPFIIVGGVPIKKLKEINKQ